MCGARQALDRFFEPQATPAQRRIISCIHRVDDSAQFAEERFDDRAAGKR